MKRVEDHICIKCIEPLTEDNWPSYFMKNRRNICRDCYNEYHRVYMVKKRLDDEYRLNYNAYFREYSKRNKDE